MTSFNLEESLKYISIQESLPWNNFKEYYVCIKEYFDVFL